METVNGTWETLPLGDVVTLQRGHDLPTQDRRDGLVPIISSSGISGYHDTPKADPPGVVTGRYGTLGQVFYLDRPYWPLNTSLYVIDFKGNDPKFIFYLLRTLDYQSVSDKSSVPGVNRNHLHSLLVVRPPLREQHMIGKVLGALDEKIELNRQMNQTLEEMARAIFRSWFVNFDPVRVKAAGGDPVKELGLSPEIAALFPGSFQDSELGEVPLGWGVRTIGDVCGIVGGGTPSTAEPAFWDGPFSWVTPRDMSRLDSQILLATERTVTQEGLERISSGLLPPGTVLMSSRAPIGYLAVSRIPVAINQGFIALKPQNGLSSAFLLQWCQQNMDLIKDRANGSTFMEISKSNFRPMPLALPPQAVLAAFAAETEPLYELITSHIIESNHLAETRDYLLPRLLNGSVAAGACRC